MIQAGIAGAMVNGNFCDLTVLIQGDLQPDHPFHSVSPGVLRINGVRAGDDAVGGISASAIPPP